MRGCLLKFWSHDLRCFFGKQLGRIVVSLFPDQPESMHTNNVPANQHPASPISEVLLIIVCKKLGDTKAFGHDYVPYVAPKAAVGFRLDIFPPDVQHLLVKSVFARRWKHQNLLTKSNKLPADTWAHLSVGYRGKDFAPNYREPDREGSWGARRLSDCRFSFRKVGFTIDVLRVVVDTAGTVIEDTLWRRDSKRYYAIVTLDVRNSLNSGN